LRVPDDAARRVERTSNAYEFTDPNPGVEA
jgi:hypothetical protein